MKITLNETCSARFTFPIMSMTGGLPKIGAVIHSAGGYRVVKFVSGSFMKKHTVDGEDFLVECVYIDCE